MPANGRWDLIRRIKVNLLQLSKVNLEHNSEGQFGPSGRGNRLESQ